MGEIDTHSSVVIEKEIYILHYRIKKEKEIERVRDCIREGEKKIGKDTERERIREFRE